MRIMVWKIRVYQDDEVVESDGRYYLDIETAERKANERFLEMKRSGRGLNGREIGIESEIKEISSESYEKHIEDLVAVAEDEEKEKICFKLIRWCKDLPNWCLVSYIHRDYGYEKEVSRYLFKTADNFKVQNVLGYITEQGMGCTVSNAFYDQ